MALTWIIAKKPDCVTIQYGSTYAKAMTTGQWRPRTNIRMVLKVRRMYYHAIADTTISFEHVDGHSGDYLNTRADRLANLGALCTTRGASNRSDADAIDLGFSEAFSDPDPSLAFGGLDVDGRRHQPALPSSAHPHD